MILLIIGGIAFILVFFSLEFTARWMMNHPAGPPKRGEKDVDAWEAKGSSIYPCLTWKNVRGYEHLPDIPDVRET